MGRVLSILFALFFAGETLALVCDGYYPVRPDMSRARAESVLSRLEEVIEAYWREHDKDKPVLEEQNPGPPGQRLRWPSRTREIGAAATRIAQIAYRQHADQNRARREVERAIPRFFKEIKDAIEAHPHEMDGLLIPYLEALLRDLQVELAKQKELPPGQKDYSRVRETIMPEIEYACTAYPEAMAMGDGSAGKRPARTVLREFADLVSELGMKLTEEEKKQIAESLEQLDKYTDEADDYPARINNLTVRIFNLRAKLAQLRSTSRSENRGGETVVFYVGVHDVTIRPDRPLRGQVFWDDSLVARSGRGGNIREVEREIAALEKERNRIERRQAFLIGQLRAAELGVRKGLPAGESVPVVLAETVESVRYVLGNPQYHPRASASRRERLAMIGDGVKDATVGIKENPVLSKIPQIASDIDTAKLVKGPLSGNLKKLRTGFVGFALSLIGTFSAMRADAGAALAAEVNQVREQRIETLAEVVAADMNQAEFFIGFQIWLQRPEHLNLTPNLRSNLSSAELAMSTSRSAAFELLRSGLTLEEMQILDLVVAQRDSVLTARRAEVTSGKVADADFPGALDKYLLDYHTFPYLNWLRSIETDEKLVAGELPWDAAPREIRETRAAMAEEYAANRTIEVNRLEWERGLRDAQGEAERLLEERLQPAGERDGSAELSDSPQDQ